MLVDDIFDVSKSVGVSLIVSIFKNFPQYLCCEYSLYASFGTFKVQFSVSASKEPATSGGVEPRHVMDVRDGQLQNAPSPIEVTLLPIVMDVRDEQSAKASNPI